MTEAVDGVCDGLGDAGGGVCAVDDLAWERFGVALTGGEIIVVVI